MGTINNSDRIATTLYSLGPKFVSGIYVKIPCIKEIVIIIILTVIIYCLLGIATRLRDVRKGGLNPDECKGLFSTPKRTNCSTGYRV
jgi:hypothetical protein